MEPRRIIKKNARDSLQAQVESFLAEKINAGVWPIGAKIPSERELAEELEVSRITVRNAVLALTNRGMFERSVGQGTFVRRTGGSRSESGSAHGTFGYVVCKEKSVRKPISTEAFYFDVFMGLEEETSKSGRHILFTYLDDFDVDEFQMLRTFLDKVDGLVIQETRNPELLRVIRESHVPAVLLAPTVTDEGMDLVTMDLSAGARRAVECLRRMGHERIAVVNGPLGLDSARLRFQAWEQAMRDTGAAPEERLVAGGRGWSAESGYEATIELLDRSPDLTAIFCANDLLAIGALSALAERGVRVPEDVSVMGFDDTELARHAVPPLSTMRIHSRNMARTAARRLVERLETANLPPIRIEFPIDLIERKTCKEVRERKQKRA